MTLTSTRKRSVAGLPARVVLRGGGYGLPNRCVAGSARDERGAAHSQGTHLEELLTLPVGARGTPVTLVSRTKFAPERLSARNNVRVDHGWREGMR